MDPYLLVVSQKSLEYKLNIYVVHTKELIISMGDDARIPKYVSSFLVSDHYIVFIKVNKASVISLADLKFIGKFKL